MSNHSAFRHSWLRGVMTPFALHLGFQVITASIVLTFVYQAMGNLVEKEVSQSTSIVKSALVSAYRTSGDVGVEQLIRTLNAEKAINGGVFIKARKTNGYDQDARQSLTRTDTSFTLGSWQVSVFHGSDGKRQTFQTVKIATLGTLLLGLEAGLIVAVFLVRRLNRRLSFIADGLQRFEFGSMEERIARSGSGDPFDRLSALLNRTFDRIQSLMAELRAVTDALAHDMRSPVMRMRVAAERARDGDDADVRRSLERIMAESDGVIRMLSDALEISRTDAGMYRDQFSDVDVGAIAFDLVDAFSPLAAVAGLVLVTQTSGNVTVSAHASLISRAIANLIDNAIKHSGGRGNVTVHVTDLRDRVIVEVSDQGRGIPSEDHTIALRRFSRLPSGATHQGAGLGLSLVSSIVSLHGGGLTLADNCPGLIVNFDLPRQMSMDVPQERQRGALE